MAKTIKFGKHPTEKEIEWFSKHVGPRTHYLPHTIGGEGWCFTKDSENPWSGSYWNLTVEDEKMLMYWTLVRD